MPFVVNVGTPLVDRCSGRRCTAAQTFNMSDSSAWVTYEGGSQANVQIGCLDVLGVASAIRPDVSVRIYNPAAGDGFIQNWQGTVVEKTRGKVTVQLEGLHKQTILVSKDNVGIGSDN